MQLKPEYQVMLQRNIQDCYVSLQCPMPSDPLEARTSDHTTEESCLGDQCHQDMELIVDKMAEIAAVLTETMFPDDNATNNLSQNVSLKS